MNVDITAADLHSLMTVLQFAVFLGIVWWAFGPSRKGRFEQDALLALDDDDERAAPRRRARGQ